jgi:AcrR family transcriptional regulator
LHEVDEGAEAMPRQINEGRVFDAVLQLWVREGYAGTTTRAIAELAGVNEATLFRRYGGKAGVVCAALRARLEQVPLRRVTATDDLRADLVRVVQAYLETLSEVGAVFPLLLVEVPRFPELGPVLEVGWTNIGAVVQVVVHHQQRGALRSESPRTAVMALLGPLFVDGLARQAQSDPLPQVDPEAFVESFLRGRGRAGMEPND